MGWSAGSRLFDEMWEIVGPHLDIDEVERIANELIDLAEDFDCDTINEAEELWRAAGRSQHWEDDDEPTNRRSALLESMDPDADGEWEDVPHRITEQGNLVARAVVQAANSLECSMLDILHCFNENEEYTEVEDLDSFCLALMQDWTMEYDDMINHLGIYEDTPDYPPETEENGLFYDALMLLTYAFGSAFEPGGPFHGESFKTFLMER